MDHQKSIKWKQRLLHGRKRGIFPLRFEASVPAQALDAWPAWDNLS